MNKDLVTRKCSNGNNNNYFSVVIKNTSLKFYWNLNAKYWFSLSIYIYHFIKPISPRLPITGICID